MSNFIELSWNRITRYELKCEFALICVTNLTPNQIEIEGRYAALGWWSAKNPWNETSFLLSKYAISLQFISHFIVLNTTILEISKNSWVQLFINIDILKVYNLSVYNNYRNLLFTRTDTTFLFRSTFFASSEVTVSR